MQTLKLTKKYEKYPEYKDSGVEWLGEIPADWKTLKGKFAFRNKKEINVGMKNDNVLSLTMNGVINRDSNNNEGLLPSDYQTFQIFEKDDLVFKLIDLENYKTSRVGIVHEKGIMSPVYIRLEAKKKYFPKYFYYLYYRLYLEGIYNFLGSGVRSSLSPHDLLELGVVIPELQEQKNISIFLDNKIKEIDLVIEKKQRLIELLKEKRTAVINNAVTKSLDPKVKLVDSNVDWIGNMPAGWKIKRLKDISSYCSRGGTPEYTEDETAHKFINQSCIRDGFLDLEKIKFSSTESKKGLIKNGDVLINSTGTGTLGRLTVFNGDDTYFADTHVTIYRPKENIHSRFLMYVIQHPAWQNYLYASCVTGSTNQIELSRNKFLEIPVLIPDLNEQIEVAAYLDKKTSLFNQSIKEIEKSIEFLQEFKSSLISNVVTGKIKI